jgi:uncharacterized membrane protein YkoI
MTRRTTIITTTVVLGALAIGSGVAAAATSDDDEREVPITGDALVLASRAALEHTGGGSVTGTELGDEDSYYEVEVTIDGSEVDVQLDADFQVVSAEAEVSGDDADE